ncbi:trypco2 family protein [Streptomyces luteireticuli]|uniref:Trypsin-co-occurring domain-containing protein n=1 Tax=Streptomyces luteireticuli TaxID=173858 RepID=A0ABN0Y6K7_9ACTN
MADESFFEGIELAEAVEAIRTGLTGAATAGEGQDLGFDVGEITMEFGIEMRKDLHGSGRVRAWVVEAGADASRGSSRTHKVTFTLTPKDMRTGGSWKVGNQRAGGISHFGPDTE